jgi:hypothetical protein
MSISADQKNASEFVWIDVTGPHNETDKALLYQTSEGDEIWIPRSQLGARKKGPDGGHVKIELPRWLAAEKGLVRPTRAR